MTFANSFKSPKQIEEDSEYSNYGEKFHTYAEKIINEFQEPMSEFGIEKFSQAISEEEEEIREKLLIAYSKFRTPHYTLEIRIKSIFIETL